MGGVENFSWGEKTDYTSGEDWRGCERLFEADAERWTSKAQFAHRVLQHFTIIRIIIKREDTLVVHPAWRLLPPCERGYSAGGGGLALCSCSEHRRAWAGLEAQPRAKEPPRSWCFPWLALLSPSAGFSAAAAGGGSTVVQPSKLTSRIFRGSHVPGKRLVRASCDVPPAASLALRRCSSPESSEESRRILDVR